jgi:hypothetical protein
MPARGAIDVPTEEPNALYRPGTDQHWGLRGSPHERQGERGRAHRFVKTVILHEKEGRRAGGDRMKATPPER